MFLHNPVNNRIMNHKRARDYLDGFHTGRHLQFSLHGASIPYSLVHVENEGWLVGDESGNIWCHNDRFGPSEDGSKEAFENILEFESGVSEISALDRSNLLVGEMLGRIMKIDLNDLREETVMPIKGVNHRAPIKCIKWQPGNSSCFASASQDGSVFFTDLRSPDKCVASLQNPHQLNNPSSKSRSTMTGLVFHPLKPELFYTTGTPDTCVRLWDLRKLSETNSRKSARKTQSQHLNPVEEFSTSTYASRKHRSSVALAIDSIGSRLFVSTSNDNIFEFLTCNNEIGPIASYATEGFTSCSFFSNLSMDPTDRFILSGSSGGHAFIWDTRPGSNSSYQLPVCAQLEVSKTAWKRGSSLNSQIACISDDSTFTLFNWGLHDDESIDSDSRHSIKRSKPVEGVSRETIQYEAIEIENNSSYSNPTSANPSIPSTPVRKSTNHPATTIRTPTSSNKSILDFFGRSPQIGQ